MKTLKRQASRKRSIATVQMAPMIDMVFLLLVFFMCVSSISQAGLQVKVDLPDSAESEVSDDFSARIILSIKENGDIYLNGRLASLEEFSSELSIIKQEASELKLSIRSDRNTEYKLIRRVIEVATKEGIYDYVYSTYQAGF
ncbi:biopolymer transporter ExbD [Puniceicoccaceae bacterium K14]|nr:biopolymer transporter ExbD [Puniceicoccaceae bacterium K14]